MNAGGDVQAPQGGVPVVGAPPLQQQPRSAPYRTRESTIFKGVTKSSSATSGIVKYDVQFVFCDGNSKKKHPKIYGFASPLAASRAFDILTCRRALEKGRSLEDIISTGKAFNTNHPLGEYNTADFRALMAAVSRDDIIYGLKQVAKRALPMTADSMVTDLREGIETAARDLEELLQRGDARQSYEPHALAPPGGRKRKDRGAGGVSTGTNVGVSPGAHNTTNSAGQQQRLQQQQSAEAALQLATAVDLGATPLAGLSAAQQQVVLAQLLTNASGMHGLFALPNSPRGGGARMTAGMASPATEDGSKFQTITSSAAAAQPLPAVARNSVESGEAATAAGPLPDGASFVQELCRLVGQTVHPEIICAADLLRIWGPLRRGQPWEGEQTTLPARMYAPHVDALREASDLEAVLSLCGALWQQRSLHNVLSLYLTSLGMPGSQQLAGGAGEEKVGGKGEERPVAVRMNEGDGNGGPAGHLPAAGCSLPARDGPVMATATMHAQAHLAAHLAASMPADKVQAAAGGGNSNGTTAEQQLHSLYCTLTQGGGRR